jgi:hypothetical protein
MGFYPRSCHQVLIEAVIAGHLGGTLAALAEGGNPDWADRLGDTPLLWAAALGHDEVMAALVKHGASLERTNAVGDTVFHAAARQNKASILTAWVQTDTPLEAVNRKGETIWSLALANDKPDAAQALAVLRAGVAWNDRPLLAALRLRQALGQGSGHLQAVLDAGAGTAWDVRPDVGPTPWEEILTRWPATAERWRPEGAQVLPFRRRPRP